MDKRKQFEAVYRAAVEAKKGSCDPAVFAQQENGDYVVGMVQAAWWGYQQAAPVPTDIRESFEKAVIERLKEGGFLEVEIRVECLPRDGEGYYDGSVNAYWHFYKQSRADLVVTLPSADQMQDCELYHYSEVKAAIEAAGIQVAA